MTTEVNLMNKPHLTAIKRSKLSAPMRYLLEQELLGLTLLDYGCGKGDDVEHLAELGYHSAGWDPHWKNEEDDRELLEGHADVVTCNYVLNVLPPKERQEVIDKLLALDADAVYVSVRRDFKEDYVTKKGTQQYLVHLDYPVVHENSGFCIYQLR
jgi:DNA phosphorothioation-associated putative methyltransferase